MVAKEIEKRLFCYQKIDVHKKLERIELVDFAKGCGSTYKKDTF